MDWIGADAQDYYVDVRRGALPPTRPLWWSDLPPSIGIATLRAKFNTDVCGEMSKVP